MRAVITVCVALFLFAPASSVSAQDTEPMTPEQKIRNAVSAAPEHLVNDAAVWDWDGSDISVLRQGTNGWTCFP